MVQVLNHHGGTHYGTSFTRERHDDIGDPSNLAKSIAGKKNVGAIAAHNLAAFFERNQI